MKKAIAYDSERPHYHYLLGSTYALMERWEKAIHQFKMAVDLEPDNAECECALGQAIFEDGNRTDGLSHIYRAMERCPSDAGILADLAMALQLARNTDKARQYARKAVGPNYRTKQTTGDNRRRRFSCGRGRMRTRIDVDGLKRGDSTL